MIGLILAGGLASRLGGGDKGFARVGGRPIIARIAATLRAQCDDLVVNANGDPARFAALRCPVVADPLADRPGPLAGVLAGLDWAAAHRPEAPLVVTVPTDTPFLPADFVARLRASWREDPPMIVCARSNGSAHPVAALWPVTLREDLRRALVEDGVRAVHGFQARHDVAYVDWPIVPHDPFLNANTPDDLAAANTIAATIDGGGAD